MQRRFGTAALALAGTALLATACYAHARAIPVGPIQLPAPNQVAQSEAVVIGKVESIADKTVKAKNYQPGQSNDLEYHVATVKIQDGLLGTKGLTHVQVAYVDQPELGWPRGRFGFQVNLTK